MAATVPDMVMTGEERPSPTEIAESGEDMEEDDDSGQLKPVKNEKRKRGVHARAVEVPSNSDEDDDDDDELESPSKRPHDDKAKNTIDAAEIRELLFGHVNEMKQAWRSFQGRLDKVESTQLQQQHEMVSLRSRTHKLEKESKTAKQMQEQTNKNVDHLTEEVRNMKVQWEELQSRKPAAYSHPAVPHDTVKTPDPWADFLLRRQQGNGNSGESSSWKRQASGSDGPPPPPDARGQRNPDVLTEEEKRTLVIGGWLRDTRKSLIEEESATLLAMDNIKSLIDAEKITVYGPRRSVGMLKFHRREGESFEGMKNRMWEMVKLAAATKYQLPSTKDAGEVKTMWASFVKTRAARSKSALVSMVRRVTIALAMESKDDQGAYTHALHTQISAYDCDWSLGTIWCGSQKLASATHKPPKEGEHVLMSGGWVSTTAVAMSAGCSVDEAKQAFEREL